jgi:hypothetical protein
LRNKGLETGSKIQKKLIPDARFKKGWDPGSGSTTLLLDQSSKITSYEEFRKM